MSATTEPLRALHDRLLEAMPDGAVHVEGECPLCTVTAAETTATEGGVMPEQFTQADLDAAVSAATGSLQQRLTELEALAQDTEVGKAVAAAVAEKEAAITELQTQLDAATAARTTAESKLTETETFWTEAIAAHEEALATAARREKRVEEAAQLGVFSSDYISEHADRFAAMSDDDFAARLEEWRLIAADRKTAVPPTTAMVASRTDQAPAGTQSKLSRLAELRANRVDVRSLGGIG